LLVSELTGVFAKKAMKTADGKNPTVGQPCPVIEHMVRKVRTDPAQLSGLRKQKISAAGEFFS